MIELVIYFVESAIGLGLFYILYRFIIQRDRLFVLHRSYLIGAVIFSLAIPLFNFPVEIRVDTVGGTLVEDAAFSLRVIHPPDEVITASVADRIGTSPLPTLLHISAFIYLVGVTLCLGRLAFSLSKMAKLIRSGDKRNVGVTQVVLLEDQQPPFSFFYYVFVNKSDLVEENFKQIMSHERVHAGQLHSLDLIFMELATAFLWFNPLIYYYKKSIKEVHEYLADRGAISSGQDWTGYLDVLLKQTMQHQNIALVSSYRQSLNKKRLKMMMRTKSSRFAGLKIGVVLPVIALLTFNFALAITTQSTNASNNVVIYEDEDFSDTGGELVLAPPISGGDITVVAASKSMQQEEEDGKVEYHTTIDIQARAGSPVLAAGNGMVFKVGTDEAGEKYIVLDHEGGYMTSYSGLGRLKDTVKTTGTRVTQGEVIGYLSLKESAGTVVLHYELILPHEIFDSTKHTQQHIQQIIDQPIAD